MRAEVEPLRNSSVLSSFRRTCPRRKQEGGGQVWQGREALGARAVVRCVHASAAVLTGLRHRPGGHKRQAAGLTACTRTTVPFLEAVASRAPSSSQAMTACRVQHTPTPGVADALPL
jgi:hypothetical protein